MSDGRVVVRRGALGLWWGKATYRNERRRSVHRGRESAWRWADRVVDASGMRVGVSSTCRDCMAYSLYEAKD